MKEQAKRVLRIEADAVAALGAAFSQAAQELVVWTVGSIS